MKIFLFVEIFQQNFSFKEFFLESILQIFMENCLVFLKKRNSLQFKMKYVLSFSAFSMKWSENGSTFIQIFWKIFKCYSQVKKQGFQKFCDFVICSMK